MYSSSSRSRAGLLFFSDEASVRVEEGRTVKLGGAEYKASIDERNVLRLAQLTTTTNRKERRLDLMLDQENELSKRRLEAAALVSDREKACQELEKVSVIERKVFLLFLWHVFGGCGFEITSFHVVR